MFLISNNNYNFNHICRICHTSWFRGCTCWNTSELPEDGQ